MYSSIQLHQTINKCYFYICIVQSKSKLATIVEHRLALRCVGKKQFHLKNINCVFKFCLLYFEPHLEILVCQYFPHESEMSSLTYKTLKPYGPELMTSVGITGRNYHYRMSIFHDLLKYCSRL